jgi:N-acetylneuraminic acid mutarotase
MVDEDKKKDGFAVILDPKKFGTGKGGGELLKQATAMEYLGYYRESLVCLPDGRVLRLGGYRGMGDNIRQEWHGASYNHNTNEWRKIQFPFRVYEGAFCITLPDGKVLVTGGYDGDWNDDEQTGVMNGVSDCYIYDPIRNTVERTGSMTRLRVKHRGCLLTNGNVFVSGGSTHLHSIVSDDLSCEEYDLVTRTWTRRASTATYRELHSCVLLSSGEVLIAGGNDMDDTCELYNPFTKTMRQTGKLPEKLSFFACVPLYD